MKKITVVEVNNINMYPPVQNLVLALLDLGYKVDLIGGNAHSVSSNIIENPNCTIIETPSIRQQSKIKKWKNRIKLHSFVKKAVIESMKSSDYLWTTSMNTIRSVGSTALKYKNILQLMELSRYGYVFRDLIKFPIDEYARNSWKTVVPEINRAYIQKVWWKLDETPYVLPNKPYSIDPGELTQDINKAIQLMKNEKRKIVLYLGGIYPDRNFSDYAKAISMLDDYVLYIAGKAFSNSAMAELDTLVEEYPVVYLGSFDPPKHLALVRYAYIGLLPYRPSYRKELSELNALYCAPNKIFEYSGYGIPMVGSDVLGLRLQFEKWNMGVCCKDDSVLEISKAIQTVDYDHDKMSQNAKEFYESVDLKGIISSILMEE